MITTTPTNTESNEILELIYVYPWMKQMINVWLNYCFLVLTSFNNIFRFFVLFNSIPYKFLYLLF